MKLFILAKLYDPCISTILQPIREGIRLELSKHKEAMILDLCCGTGHQLKLLAKHGYNNLHGLDLSQTMLDIAQQGICAKHYYCADATATGLASGAFDAIIVSMALHEKNRRNQEMMIKEIYRLLKDGGRLIVADYLIDEQTSHFSTNFTRIIERAAGKSHYINYLNYIRQGGLNSLLTPCQFNLIGESRHLGLSVVIRQYKKMHHFIV